MIPFTFVTGSANKIAEAERILGLKLDCFDLDLPEIQAVEVEEVVIFKVKEAYRQLNKPLMIEDTGLYIEAWQGLPGALIKWFIKRVGNEGICQMLETFPHKQARAKTAVAAYTGTGEPVIFAGEIQGQIAPVPTGEAGFGWDKIFIPAGADKTFAQMLPAEKDQYSMRRLAFEAMLAHYS